MHRLPRLRKLLPVLLAGCALADPPAASFSILNPSAFAKYLRFPAGGGGGTDENAWAQSNIPFFECDSEDYNVAYYFRWHMLHSHMNASGWSSKSDGKPRYLFTEFTGVAATHSGSAGHHIMEARWLRDPAVVTDYGLYWALAGQGQTSYSFWFSWASFEAYKVLEPALGGAWLSSIYAGLKGLYVDWITGSHPGHGGVMIQGNGSNGMRIGQSCFFKSDGYDAEENSISGSGCRPISHACAFGEASGLGRIAAAVNGSAEEAKTWADYSQEFRSRLTDLLWNQKLDTFSTLAVFPTNASNAKAPNPPKIDGKVNFSMTCNRPEYEQAICDAKLKHAPDGTRCSYYWQPNALTAAREIGALSTPWMVGAVADPNDTATALKYAKAWQALNDPAGFDARWGPRTAERAHPCYNYTRYDPVVRQDGRAGRHDDNWNGPSWPYETSKMLTAYATVLNDFSPEVHAQANISAANFAMWMERYVFSHTRSTVVNGSVAEGKNGTVPWVGENLHPDDGYWLSRYLRFRQNCTPPGPAKQHWNECNLDELYNHSSFIDLIIAALLGLRASTSNALFINPLAVDRKYFALDNLRYRGRNLAIAFDRDGLGRYHGCPKGLCVYVGGKVVASRPDLGPLRVAL